MDMTGERRIPAPREKVWDALNDPAVLKASIPGCESLEKISPEEMTALVGVKLGPISARFSGRVNLTDLDPPNAYRISGEGQGGAAGFAKGGATVNLRDDEGGTLLSYVVQAQVGGKIAQLGARLIDASAKQMADQFFDRFTSQVTTGPAASGPVTTGPVTTGPVTTGPVTTGPVTTGPVTTGPLTSTITPPVAPLASAVAPRAAPARAPAINLLSLVPREPFGFPLIAWIGGFVWLLIFILIFGSYL